MESLSGIDVQLTKRYDLIPNILKIAKKFMEHEKSLITEVTSLRANLHNNYQHDNKESIAEYFKMSNEIAGKMFEDELELAYAVIDGVETRGKKGKHRTERTKFNKAN